MEEKKKPSKFLDAPFRIILDRNWVYPFKDSRVPKQLDIRIKSLLFRQFFGLIYTIGEFEILGEPSQQMGDIWEYEMRLIKTSYYFAGVKYKTTIWKN